MTTVIETMNRADDSDAELAVVFYGFETTYLDLAIDFLDEPVVLVDLIELAIWEGYGLVRHVEPFFTTLPERHADAAMRCLGRIIAELRRETLDYQLSSVQCVCGQRFWFRCAHYPMRRRTTCPKPGWRTRRGGDRAEEHSDSLTLVGVTST